MQLVRLGIDLNDANISRAETDTARLASENNARELSLARLEHVAKLASLQNELGGVLEREQALAVRFGAQSKELEVIPTSGALCISLKYVSSIG